MMRLKLTTVIFPGATCLLLLSNILVADDAVHRMQLPGKSWAITVAIPGFKIEEQWTRKDESGMMMRATNQESGVILSLYLERESKPRTSIQCRGRYFPKALGTAIPKSKVRRWVVEPLALGQYMIESAGGVRVQQMHVNAYLGKDDVCMDLHLSKGPFEEAERSKFDTILSSVTVVDGP